jgi:CRP-like cAMP-binding protein
MPERSLETSYDFFEELTDYCLDDRDEFEQVRATLQDIRHNPEAGEWFVFSGRPGDHYVIRSGRFLIIYQFSDETVWVKTFQVD